MANVSKLDNSNSLHSVGKPQRLPPGYDCNETSTHAPCGGEPVLSLCFAAHRGFNSHPLHRGEPILAGYPIRASPTSTPVPVWGRTAVSYMATAVPTCFNTF